jgi:hypothetical protein
VRRCRACYDPLQSPELMFGCKTRYLINAFMDECTKREMLKTSWRKNGHGRGPLFQIAMSTAETTEWTSCRLDSKEVYAKHTASEQMEMSRMHIAFFCLIKIRVWEIWVCSTANPLRGPSGTICNSFPYFCIFDQNIRISSLNIFSTPSVFLIELLKKSFSGF